MRKEKIIALLDDDKKLHFHLRQMSAFDFENWLRRLGHILRRAGLDIPPGQEVQASSEALVRGNFRVPVGVFAAGTDKPTALMCEMLLSCAHIDNTGRRTPLTPDVAENLVDRMSTLLGLYAEALAFNLDWALADPEDTPSLAPLNLPQETRYKQAQARKSYSARPLAGTCEALAISGLATMKELKNDYSFRGALELIRVLNIKNYDAWLSMDASQVQRC